MAHELLLGRWPCWLLLVILLLQRNVEIDAIADGNFQDYQNEWVVRAEGGPQVASLLALQSGYKQVATVRGFEDTYLWRKANLSFHRKRGNFVPLTTKGKVLWVEQQKAIKRHKRDYFTRDDEEPDNDPERPLYREKRLLMKNNDVIAQQQPNSDKFTTQLFNDELWPLEWRGAVLYPRKVLRRRGQDTRSNKDLPKLDLNVLPLYRLGITGRGIRVAVLDDGLEHTHEDLRRNYDPEISYDVNDRDDDPMPRYDYTGLNGHGTRCAGEIAMEADNGKCGVGVAFEASIGGIKLLDGMVNDRVEGEALGHRTDLVDIYTASWGPADDGRSLEAPGRLANEAIHRGIEMGRGGKGSLYVWASGNGGSKFDDCGCDGYVGSIYTIAIGSASQTGRFPWYGERCPATLATTYSSGAYNDQMIATTDLKNKCTTRHTGTSASAPLAAGILALALQVNQELTWRDVQHLIVWTSEYSPLRDNPGWSKNSAGFWFNSRFGFGLMNAHKLVISANNWTAVPQKFICQTSASYTTGKFVEFNVTTVVEFDVVECHGQNDIFFLEHVEMETSLEYKLRGSLEMHLRAPSGTKAEMLSKRKLDDSKSGFRKWKFMSLATWGENPFGTWTLEVIDKVGPATNNGTLGELKLIIHGTKAPPPYRVNGPRIYNNDYNRQRQTSREEEPHWSEDYVPFI